MLAIRLKRVGRTNDPSFRIIVQDHRRSPKKTRGLVEYVGSYDARKGTPQIDGERVKYWISQGARPSDTVHNLLVDAKIISDKKVNAMNKKTRVVSAAEPKVVSTAEPKVAKEATKDLLAHAGESIAEAQKKEVAEPEASIADVSVDLPTKVSAV
ncbi:MAG: 30S ribosomal protein S16 [Patescibacteria group bacterium]